MRPLNPATATGSRPEPVYNPQAGPHSLRRRRGGQGPSKGRFTAGADSGTVRHQDHRLNRPPVGETALGRPERAPPSYDMGIGKQSKGIAAMKFSVMLDRDEDGAWIAECPAIPGCVSEGATREEAVANVREAIALCLQVRAERGLPLTIETRQVEVAL